MSSEIQARVMDPSLSAIRRQVGALDDRIPFLLLPVRVETRFMEVDHSVFDVTVPVVTTATIIKDLGIMQEILTSITKQPLELTEKPKKKELYAKLDRFLTELAAQCARMESYHRDTIQADAGQIARIQGQWTKILDSADAVPGQLAKLQSNYLRKQYQATFTKIRENTLHRVHHLFFSVTIPKMDYFAVFKKSSASVSRQSFNGVAKLFTAPVTKTALRKATFSSSLATSLDQLKQSGGGLVTEAPEHLASNQKTWQTADQGLKQLKLVLEKEKTLPAKTRRTLEELLQKAADLKPRIFSNKDLTYSVQTYQALQQDLMELGLEIHHTPSARRKNRLETVNGLLKKSSDRLATRLNRQVLLPAAYKANLLAALAKLDLKGFSQRAEGADKLQHLELQKNAGLLARLIGAIATETDLGRGTPVLIPSKTVDELWVRIFPDDIFVQSHEPELTVEEIAAGKTYWHENWRAKGNAEAAEAAWRLLCSKYTVQRAAWIVRQLQPTLEQPAVTGILDQKKVTALSKNLETVSAMLLDASRQNNDPALRQIIVQVKHAQKLLAQLKQGEQTVLPELKTLWDKILDLLRKFGVQSRPPIPRRPSVTTPPWLSEVNKQTALFQKNLAKLTTVTSPPPKPPGVSLVFPEVPVKTEAWTHAPKTHMLPDKFVVLTMVGDSFTNVLAGKKIPDPLILGLNPQKFSSNPFTYDAEGNLLVNDSDIKWLTDFQEAVNCGMGIVVPLTPEEKKKGFDKVLVLGVKNQTALAAKQQLEALLENHHYTADGVAFIPAGTPTNNTERAKAGFMSLDDKSAAWKIECGEAPLFNAAETDPLKIADGKRLADALGINPAVFQHIGNSDLTEISQAMAVNRALTPATLGYFLEEIIAPLFPRDTVTRIRHYFSQNVIGRGLLPSLRIGTQPYGVLVTSAFSRFKMLPDENVVITEADKADAKLLETKRQQRFEVLLRKFLWMLHGDWKKLMLEKVKCAENTDTNNPQSHFMNMLGLEAHSLTNYFRYSVNCASRLAYADTHPANVNFDPASSFSPYVFMERIAGVLQLSDAEKIKLQSTVLSLPLYRMRFLENHEDLKGVTVAQALAEKDTFLQWLASNNPYTIWNHNRTTGLPSNSLLFLLLRHAWLLNYRETALDILQDEKLITEDIRTKAGSPEFYHTFSPIKQHKTFITKWNYLFTKLNDLNGLFDLTFDTTSALYQRLQSGKSMAEYLLKSEPHLAGHAARLQQLELAQADFKALQAIPTATLDRVLAEHLDTCSYRLDAWQLGLAHQRLGRLRQRTVKPEGIYLGAFGWVENLRPDPERPLAKTIPADLSKPADGPVYYDYENEGFIHAPSINHAMTAAILRSGYVANRNTEDLQNPLAVNLTSERVRMALRLMEGVRQGVDVGTLLGYQFERGLHERYKDHVELDSYIYPFRRNFPGTPAVEAGLENNEEPRQVVDGLAILKAVRKDLDTWGTIPPGATLFETLLANTNRYPYGLVDYNSPLSIKPSLLPPAATTELEAVLKEIDRMADGFDALSDLLMAESVYQVAQGNHTRAAAVVSAMAEGKAPPQVEVINTPRTGKTISQRVVLHLPPISAQSLSPQSGLSATVRKHNLDLARAVHWENIPFSPRALAEPSLNRWLGAILGDPEKIRCWVEYTANATPFSLAVSLQDLQLQPLDAVLLLGGSAARENASELNARIAYFVREKQHLGLDTELTIQAKARGANLLKSPSEILTAEIKTFYEIAPMFRSLADCLANSRFAAADDLILPENNDFPDRTGQDIGELKLRILDLSATVKEVILTWLNLIDQTQNNTSYNLTDLKIDEYLYDDEKITLDTVYLQGKLPALRAFLFAGSGLGVPYAIPHSVLENSPEQVKALARQGNDVFRTLLARWRAAQPLLAKDAISTYVDAAKELAGKNLVVIPHCKANNPAALQSAAAQSPALLSQAASQGELFAMDSWLQGLAKSRKKMNTLETLKLLSSLLNQPFPEMAPSQMPESAYWVGLKFPADFKPPRNTLSLVHLNLPADWSQPLCGLVIDEWTETLPSEDELTGITFHYNQPDSTAPQSLLLAVTPEETGHWQWDNLVYTLLDTLELAKLRAVEPEHVDTTLFSQLLPTVMGEVVPTEMQDVSINPLGVQIVVDFATNNPAES
ncbi:MAG: hypothetical protein ACYDIB_00050 [Desulfobulbia bacterium]|nr:MAG: hypothetical protein CVU58_00020 [Deltaproteobacteria bacterium HGW-Deltaproteobacteria-16]